VTDNSDDDYNSRGGMGQGSLTRDNKHTRSARKIKPMYALGNNQGSKQMLKVVHEDEHSSANDHHHGIPQNYLNKANNLGSLVSIVSSNSGVSGQQYHMMG
tara:strand:- start:51 stop:353 length:303 start_codon:yes stop_codon:yes gene_type:complete